MRDRQRVLFFQDSIHLCTKLRNRLLSPKATMLLGEKLVSIEHLVELIESSSKMNHNLVKSDVLRQRIDRITHHVKRYQMKLFLLNSFL